MNKNLLSVLFQRNYLKLSNNVSRCGRQDSISLLCLLYFALYAVVLLSVTLSCKSGYLEELPTHCPSMSRFVFLLLFCSKYFSWICIMCPT